MCEHVVKVENATRIIVEGSDVNPDGGQRGQHEASTTVPGEKVAVAVARSDERTGSGARAAASSRRRGVASNRIDEPSECRVQLYERNELQV